MQLTEKTARQFQIYVKKLVKSQPTWLKSLFDREKILFLIEEDGMIQLGMDDKLDEEVKEHAQRLIHSYIKRHPSKLIASRDIFH